MNDLNNIQVGDYVEYNYGSRIEKLKVVKTTARMIDVAFPGGEPKRYMRSTGKEYGYAWSWDTKIRGRWTEASEKRLAEYQEERERKSAIAKIRKVNWMYITNEQAKTVLELIDKLGIKYD